MGSKMGKKVGLDLEGGRKQKYDCNILYDILKNIKYF